MGGQSDPGKDPGTVFPLPSKSVKMIPDVNDWHPDKQPLSQDVIQHGISYVPKVKNEHASCGGPNIMVPLLKHWTALPALSYFLTNAMQIRESSRRIVVPSTFKPPPRVAMPESRQSAWLQDLANNEYPLRRLGRTVPSGLKGLTLLEQCYQHSVPTFRMVWLAKCVGASEIRSLKRKYAENDNLQPPDQVFMAEWTADVLTFLEQAVAGHSSPDWSSRLKYAADAVSVLFFEMLLDRMLVLRWLTDEIQGKGKLGIACVPALLQFCYRVWDAFKLEPQAIQLVRAIALRAPTVEHSLLTLEAMDALLLRLFDVCPDAFTLPDLWPRLERQLKRAVDMPPILTNVRRDKTVILASIERMRKRNDVFSFSLGLPAEWEDAAKVGRLLTDFSMPFSVPELVGKLRQLRLSTSTLLSALLSWTLRKASSRSVHLCVAVCQQLTAFGLRLQDCLVDFLMGIKPLQCSHTLFALLAWLYRSNIFRLETYFRRLMALGILHLEGPLKNSHCSILQNLPFSFMSRHLRSQAEMLSRQAASTRNVEAEASAVLEAQPQTWELPQDLKRDEELRLAAAIYEQYKARMATPEKVSPHMFASVVEALDKLGDKYTTFSVVWLTLSSAVDQDLYMFAHLVSLQNLYFFVCMRVSNALIQVVYARRTDFSVSINEQSFENANIVVMLRSALKDQPDNQVNLYLRSVESCVSVSTMTPDSIADDDAFGQSASDLVEQALDKADRDSLLQLRAHYARSPLFIQKARAWLGSNPQCCTGFIVWLAANSCVAFSDVYNCLIDIDDSKLFDTIFKPAQPEWGLTSMESVYLEIIRQKFTLLCPPEEIYYLLGKITNAVDLELAVGLLMGRIRYDSKRCARMLFEQIPDGEEKVQCLTRVVSQQLGLPPAGDRIECLLQLLEVCNVFNFAFCQIGVWINHRGAAPEDTAALVLSLIKSGRAAPASHSLQVLFDLLDQDTKRAIQNAAELEFLTGPVPNPCVGNLLQILGTIEASSDHDKGLKLIECVARIIEACSTITINIRPTVEVLLKLITLECAKDTDNIYLPTVAAMLPTLQEAPVIAQSAELSLMIADCLRILNRQDKLEAPIQCQTSPLEGLVLYSASQGSYNTLDVWPFDLIEETSNSTGNDVPLDLAKFETYIELKDSS